MTITPTNEQYHGLGKSEWPLYSLFGLTMASDFAFVNRLVPGAGSPDVTFTCVPDAPYAIGWERTVPAYASPSCIDSGKSVFYLFRRTTFDVMRFTEIADFYLWPDRIVCHLLNPDYDYLVEIYLLGTVLSYWLELQGMPTLHAAAVVTEDRAVAFIGTNGASKSSLAATFMQAGYPLLTDDILPVQGYSDRFVGFSGYPQMRLWPDQAQYFLGHYRNLEQVHPAYAKRRVPVGSNNFGDFCEASQPLSCIYLLERSESAEGAIKITSVSPRDAVIELVRHSFGAHIVEAIGLQAQRFGFFIEMARCVTMRRIIYPSGMHHLPRVRYLILQDLGIEERP